MYAKLCATMDTEVKRSTVMPRDMYDAAIVFLASVVVRSKDPNADFELLLKTTLDRVSAAIRETDSLISMQHN